MDHGSIPGGLWHEGRWAISRSVQLPHITQSPACFCQSPEHCQSLPQCQGCDQRRKGRVYPLMCLCECSSESPGRVAAHRSVHTHSGWCPFLHFLSFWALPRIGCLWVSGSTEEAHVLLCRKGFPVCPSFC